MSDRLDRLRALFALHDADALLLSSQPDLRWATGFTGSNGLLLLTAGAAHFLTDGRYDEQARQEVAGASVHVPGYDLLGHAAAERLLGDATRVLLVADRVTLAERERLDGPLPGLEWRPVAGLLDELRASKDEDEIASIRVAQRLTEAVFEAILPLLRPGVTEREIASEIVYRHLQGGAARMAFEPIVASGPRGALPHGRPSDRAMQAGELVVLDFGGMVDGYASDMTRTVAIGEPGEAARQAYAAVREALEAATEALHGGASGKAVDAVARDVLRRAGFGDYFTHGLGHGVGLDVHEWPRLSYAAEHVIPENAVVTLEPGVYLPGRFGIRIEDLAVARRGGAEVLTTLSHALIVL